jgi:hypothetical protein
MMQKKNLLMVKNSSFKNRSISFSVLKDFSSRSSHFDSSSNNQAKLRIQLKYDNGKLFVMVRYANNLVRKFIFILLKYKNFF